MKNSIHYFLCITIIILTITSCKKDKPEVAQPTVQIPVYSEGVFIINEGNFNGGNAKVSYYNITTNAVSQDLYQPANNVPLGDICQSMVLHNGNAYLVVNNSQKITVVNPSTFVETAMITGLGSPRYLLPIDNQKAYVSDLFSSNVSIINLTTNTVSGTIPIGSSSEEMVLASGKVFVTSFSSDKVYVIDVTSDAVVDSIIVGPSSNSIKLDVNGKLWVLCNGSYSDAIPGSLYRINPSTNEVEQTLFFTNHNEYPNKLRINGGLNTLYFLNTNVYSMSITDTVLPANAFVTSSGNALYGLGIDPLSGDVFVSDAVDYIQSGKVYRYESSGAFVNSFTVGVLPGEFCFN
jgi:YVTN family beta-propeller protein